MSRHVLGPGGAPAPVLRQRGGEAGGACPPVPRSEQRVAHEQGTQRRRRAHAVTGRGSGTPLAVGGGGHLEQHGTQLQQQPPLCCQPRRRALLPRVAEQIDQLPLHRHARRPARRRRQAGRRRPPRHRGRHLLAEQRGGGAHTVRLDDLVHRSLQRAEEALQQLGVRGASILRCGARRRGRRRRRRARRRDAGARLAQGGGTWSGLGSALGLGLGSALGSALGLGLEVVGRREVRAAGGG